MEQRSKEHNAFFSKIQQENQGIFLRKNAEAYQKSLL